MIKILRLVCLICLIGFICLLPFPSHAKTWKSLTRQGTENYKKQNYTGALEAFNEAQRKDPANPTIQFNKGCAAYKLNDLEEATQDFSKAQFKESEPSARSQTHYNLGNVYFKQGQMDKAVEAYKKALISNPGNNNARHNLALALRREQQKQNSSQGGGGGGGGSQDQQGQNEKKEDQNKDKKEQNKNKETQKSPIGQQELEALFQAFENEEAKQAQKMQRRGKPEMDVEKDW